MIVYNCDKCFNRIKHEFGAYYTCPHCGKRHYFNKRLKSELPPKFYDFETSDLVPTAIEVTLD